MPKDTTDYQFLEPWRNNLSDAEIAAGYAASGARSPGTFGRNPGCCSGTVATLGLLCTAGLWLLGRAARRAG